jgi:Uma2 family endonuclease
MHQIKIRTRHWTRLDYERLVEAAIFDPTERLELLGGELIIAEPQGTRHAAVITLVADALRRDLGSSWQIRVKAPLALDAESEPEPDVAVVPGSPRDYLAAHPSRPALLVEVAESSLALDRGKKASLYARAGVADYWLVNLVDEVLEVHRQPVPDPTAPHGWRFATMTCLDRGCHVAPLAAPDALVPVADLLP